MSHEGGVGTCPNVSKKSFCCLRLSNHPNTVRLQSSKMNPRAKAPGISSSCHLTRKIRVRRQSVKSSCAALVSAVIVASSLPGSPVDDFESGLTRERETLYFSGATDRLHWVPKTCHPIPSNACHPNAPWTRRVRHVRTEKTVGPGPKELSPVQGNDNVMP